MFRYYNSGNPTPHGTRCNYPSSNRSAANPGNVYNALDIAASTGTNVYAIETGKVVENGYQGGGFGNYVVLEHSNGMQSLYGHLKSRSGYSVGSTVSRGQVIGYVGSTGASSGPHVHFEIYYPSDKSIVINPWQAYFQGKIAMVIGSNSYRANINYAGGDPYAAAWCRWLSNSCSLSNGDYIFIP